MVLANVLRVVPAPPEATCGFSDGDGPTENDLLFTPLTGSAWHVADARLPAGDPFRLLGFISEIGEACEVLQLGATFQRHHCTSFDAAIEFLLTTCTQRARDRLHGDLMWIPTGYEPTPHQTRTGRQTLRWVS